MSLLLPAIIGAGSSLLGGLIGAGSNASNNRANMELAKYQNEANLHLWNLQNAYNTPSAQMERLKAAGLNPNLIYGSGSSAANTAAAPESTKVPHLEAYTDNTWMREAGERAVMMTQELENARAQGELIKSQQQVNQQEMLVKLQNMAESMSRTSRNEFDLELAKDLRTNSIEVANENLRRIQVSNKAQEVRTAMDEFDLAMRPLQAKLTEAQIAQIRAATSAALWDLDLAKTGQFRGTDFWSQFANQVIRMVTGKPNMISSVAKGVAAPIVSDKRTWLDDIIDYFTKPMKGRNIK